MYRRKVQASFLAALLCCVLAHVHGVSPPGPSKHCPKGQAGDPGDVGPTGRHGVPGPKGEPGNPSGPCTCEGPPGEKGARGYHGIAGQKGDMGAPGYSAEKGESGDPGRRGAPGAPGKPLSFRPSSTSDTNFIPFVVKKRLPNTICHHFTRHAYVPNVPNKWLAWYEVGQSSYSLYNNWMHYSARFRCPCALPKPVLPTPSIEDALRRL